MPPQRMSQPHRLPTDGERAFLRAITARQPELARQIECCRVADYDVTGWWEIDILAGPPAQGSMIDGPAISAEGGGALAVDVIRPGAALTTLRIGPAGIDNITPAEPPDDPRVYLVEIIFWLDDAGMLTAIEVVSYGDGSVADPFTLFVDAARRNAAGLVYPSTPARRDEA